MLEQPEEQEAKVDLEGKEIENVPEPEPLPTAEDVIAIANKLGKELRELIVLAKRVPGKKGVDVYQDPRRSLGLAQMHLQTGLMWLRRAVKVSDEF